MNIFLNLPGFSYTGIHMSLGRKFFVVLAACSLLLNGFLITMRKNQAGNDIDQSSYPLLAKRIFTDDPNDTIVNLSPVRAMIDQTFDAVKTPYSVYFEYLPTGTSVRNNSEEQLTAASLVKLPVVMNLYRAAELGKINLDQKTRLAKDDLDPLYGELYKKGPGYALTLREAARIMIAESDNTAQRVINRNIKGLLTTDQESMPWLDIDYDLRGPDALFNSRSFSSMLKCLYFSCYLNPDASQEILTFLTESNYNERLTKYIPDGLKVAHKFGFFDEQGTHSDCGIFYIERRNYILCIMMQGADETVSATISKVSKEILDIVTNL